MVGKRLDWTNRLQYFKLFSLVSVFLLSGCAGQPEQLQPLPSSTQPAAAQAVAASPTATPAPSATDTPVPTETPELSPTYTPTNTPLPPPTPTPVIANDYRVSYVVQDDVLNMRAGPGINFEVVATLPPDATGVQLTSTPAESDWVEIDWQDFTGWVNRYFLTEEVTSEAFCNDPAVRDLVDAFRTALEERDGTGLAQLTHPQRGLLVRLNWWNNEVHFNHQEIPNLFTAEDIQDWGFEDGSGAPIEGPFNEIVVPILDKDFAGNPQIHCNELVAGSSAGIIQLPFEYEAVNYYAVHRPPQENELDWGTWVLGIEYWDGKPHLSFLVHYQWEI